MRLCVKPCVPAEQRSPLTIAARLTRRLPPSLPPARPKQSSKDNVCLAFSENQCAGLCRAEERLEGIFNDCVRDPYSAGGLLNWQCCALFLVSCEVWPSVVRNSGRASPASVLTGTLERRCGANMACGYVQRLPRNMGASLTGVRPPPTLLPPRTCTPALACRQEGQAAVVGLKRLGNRRKSGQHRHAGHPGAA